MTDSQTQTAPARQKPRYRAKGKIAWLPKPVRDRINQMLLDGETYAGILAQLGEEGKSLNISNLFRYHKGPYRHWLREQHWLAEARAKEESAAELFRDIDTAGLNQAALQTTLLQIYEAIRDVSAGDLRQMLASDPRAYARIVNSLSRLSKEQINVQKYRDASARAAAFELKNLDPERDLNDREYQILAEKMDDFFKKPRRKSHPQNSKPATDTNNQG